MSELATTCWEYWEQLCGLVREGFSFCIHPIDEHKLKLVLYKILPARAGALHGPMIHVDLEVDTVNHPAHGHLMLLVTKRRINEAYEKAMATGDYVGDVCLISNRKDESDEQN